MNLSIIFIDVITIFINFIFERNWFSELTYMNKINGLFTIKTEAWGIYFLKTLVLKTSKISQDQSVLAAVYATYHRELGAGTL